MYFVFIQLLIGFALLFRGQNALAQPDYVIDAAVRSYSLGVAAIGNAGYQIPLWEEKESPFYGMLRPSISVIASGASIAGRIDLEFAPTKFFSLIGGKMWMNQFALSRGEDCGANSCIGNLETTDLTARLQFALGKFLGSARFTMTFIDDTPSEVKNTIDISNYVLLAPSGEVSSQTNLALAYNIFDDWSLGVIHQQAELRKNDGTQNSQYMIAMKREDRVTYVGGLGRYESELKPSSISAVASVKYAID